MPNAMAVQPNIGGALCSMPQSLADAHYYTVSQKNVPPMACYNFDTHEWILIFFGSNVTDNVGNQKIFTVPPQITCASALPVKTGKQENHIVHSIGLCYTHNAPARCFPERKNCHM